MSSSNGGPGGAGPWGRGPPPPNPEIEKLIKAAQDRFKRLLPGGGSWRAMALVAILGAVALGIWSA